MALTELRAATERVEQARELFLSKKSDDLSAIRPIVARSWYRCRAAGVDPVVERAVLEEGRVDGLTLEAAEQHLRKLDEFAADIGGYVNLTAPNGALVRPSFLREDDGFPAGYSLREECSGSNGEGLAIEEGRSVWLAPEEHYRMDMRRNWCFAALIRDPLHSRVRGVVGLTLPADRVEAVEPSSTMLMLEGVAARIEREIEDRVSSRERTLLHEYLTVSRRRRSAAVVAMDGKNLFMNTYAAASLEGSDFSVISSYVKEVMSMGEDLHRMIGLQGMGPSVLDVSTVPFAGSSAGAVAVFKPNVEARTSRHSEELAARVRSMQTTPMEDIALPTLDGVSAEFLRVTDLVRTAIAQSRSATIIGEGGSGRRRVADAIVAGLSGLVTFDAANRVDGAHGLGEVLAGCDRTELSALIVEHADELSLSEAAQLRDHMLGASATRVILTAARQTTATQLISEAVAAVEISIAPLRSRREDIPVLANAIAKEFGDRTPSRNLLAVLTNADWPRNVQQLRATLAHAAPRGSGPHLTVDDLPHGFGGIARNGRLSRLEEAEFSELRVALREAEGNRRLAAEMLEIGRSTLYRRMDYFRARGFDL